MALTPSELRYVVVTPARDEEATIGETIRSMVAQRHRPLRWVIVDDGSRDGTRAIVESACAEHPWIELLAREDRGHRELGPGVVHAFEAGFERVADLDWHYVVKLDADLSFDESYFANLIEHFANDSRLGMASGKTYLREGDRLKLEWCHDDHVRGPAKMYSRSCWKAIGGLRPVRGWDFIDEVTARMKGFGTRSFAEEVLVHHRPIDGRQRHVVRSRYDMGRLYHHLGYDGPYLAVRAARSCVQDYPRVIGGAALLAGFLVAALSRAERYDADFTAFVRREQRARFRWSHLRDYLGATFRRLR